ncbi:MAG: SCP2 sterol-binding domain-containing protein [Thermodesulfobacteriota bacterium]
MTCAEVFARMGEKFQEFRLKDVHGIFQFHVRGPGGGQWHAICRGDHCQVKSGVHQRPDVTITASADTVVRLAEGRMRPTQALLTRKVKVKGDLLLIAKMKVLLSPWA